MLLKASTGVADPRDMKRGISCPRQRVQQIPGCPILCKKRKGWGTRLFVVLPTVPNTNGGLIENQGLGRAVGNSRSFAFFAQTSSGEKALPFAHRRLDLINISGWASSPAPIWAAPIAAGISVIFRLQKWSWTRNNPKARWNFSESRLKNTTFPSQIRRTTPVG